MSAESEITPSERKPSAVDVFCTQTYEDFQKQSAAASRRRASWITYALAGLCLLLIAGGGVLAWSLSSFERQRDTLLVQLREERTARIKAQLDLKDAELRLASEALETRVRRDIVDERMAEQQGREAELAREAEAVRLAKLAEADCFTPRSVITAVGL